MPHGVPVYLVQVGATEAESVLEQMLQLQHVPVEVTRFGMGAPAGGPDEARALAAEDGALLLYGGAFPLHRDSVASLLGTVPLAAWREDAGMLSVMRRDWEILWPPVGRRDSEAMMEQATTRAKERLEQWKASPDDLAPGTMWKQGIGYAVHGGIPCIIHMAWLGPRPLSDLSRRCIASWREHHPGWNIILWCDEESEAGLAEYHPARIDKERVLQAVSTIYGAAANYGEKTDILRLVLLERFGGVWVDCDMECLRPIDELCEGSGFVGAGTHPRYLQCENAIMASCVGHPLFRHMLYALPWWMALRPGLDTVHKTGPVYVDRWVRLWLGDRFELSRDELLTVDGFSVHPRSYWYQEEGIEKARASSGYGYHWWRGEWFRPPRVSDIDAVERASVIRPITSVEEREHVAGLAGDVPAGGLIVEIGCLYGGMTAILALSAPGARIVTIDDFSWHPEDGEETSAAVVARNMEAVGARNVEVMEGDSREIGSGWDKPIDLLWIDGGHSYEYISADLSNFGRCAQVIACHDYDSETWPTIRVAVDEFLRLQSGAYCLDHVAGSVAVLKRSKCLSS